MSCITCHMSQMLDVKNTIYYIFLESLYKIQFNGHFECVTCHMSQILLVKISSCKYLIQWPICYIFLEKGYKIQFNGHALNIPCHITQMLHITNIKLTILPETVCHNYHYFCILHITHTFNTCDMSPILILKQLSKCPMYCIFLVKCVQNTVQS